MAMLSYNEILQGKVIVIDDEPYEDFDREALSVKLPDTQRRPRVKVRLTPTKVPARGTP